MQTVYLEYVPKLGAYGVKDRVISDLTARNEIAEILLPKTLDYTPDASAPIIGFLLGEDTLDTGDGYYTIGKNYLQAILNTGVGIRFLDYDHPLEQMQNCQGFVLPGGCFANPEYFYVNGKVSDIPAGKRYLAYQTVIMQAYKEHKPMLGICAGAQMIGALLGDMKMYRQIPETGSNPIRHKPQEASEVCMHPLHLIPDTPLYEIMGIYPSENHIMMNSRHSQAMVPGGYMADRPVVRMDIYAVSEGDNIPEIWGNDRAGILCVQGHPEDLITDKKMQNLYGYIAQKASEYKAGIKL